ncbi:CFI-box-CTERM domain-containing protein [Paraburkholderia sp. SIMBA_049]
MADERKGPGMSVTPTTPANQTKVVQLSNNGLHAGNLIDTALANLSQEQVSALGVKAAEELLRLKVKAQEQGMDYVEGKKAIEDHIEAFDALDKRGRMTRQSVNSEIKTGAGRMNITSKSGASCFVATAAYGGADHPDVRFLRAFRDEYLEQRRAGRAFIDWYWRVGPKLARVVGSSKSLRRASRIALQMLVGGIRLFWHDRDGV